MSIHNIKAPPGWDEIRDCPVEGGRWFRARKHPLAVIVTIENGWLHVSASSQNRMPSYGEMKRVKADFIGRERDAIEYHAKESEHINIHPNVRHLWSRMDGERLMPDMRRFEPLIGAMGI